MDLETAWIAPMRGPFVISDDREEYKYYES